MDGPYRGKRIVDLAIACAVIVPSLLIGLPVAVAVKLTSRGPVLFRQQRVGLNGATFDVVKFRTMIDRPDNPIYPDPNRITTVGRVLRRTSLDELPQLLNVLRGEMSVVGPRPGLPYQVERYSDRQLRRLSVRPGITGLAQVRGRNEVAWGDRIEIDLEYLERQSPLFDLRILASTVRAVLGGSGVKGHPEDDPLASP